jgi:hypothetical protein
MQQMIQLLWLLTAILSLDCVNGQVWQQRYDDIDGEAESDESGSAVALSGDGSIVAIGSPNVDAGGHVRVFRADDDAAAWLRLDDIIDGGGDGGELVRVGVELCRIFLSLISLLKSPSNIKHIGHVGGSVGRWLDCCNWRTVLRWHWHLLGSCACLSIRRQLVASWRRHRGRNTRLFGTMLLYRHTNAFS